MNKINLTIILSTFAGGVFAQTKTVVATYDSARIAHFGELSNVFFSADGKPLSFEVPTSNRFKTWFWETIPQAKDSINGEWEDHTVSKSVGKQYELTYSTKNIEGEGGMRLVNLIETAVLYDSTYIAFLDYYKTWKTNNQKLAAQNTSIASIAQKCLSYLKTGNYTALKALADNNETRNFECCGDHGIVKTIKKMEKLAADKTPATAKTQIAEAYKKELSKFTELKTPVAVYSNALEAFVITHFKGETGVYCVWLTKINGQWKVTRVDDAMGNPSPEIKGNPRARLNFERAALKYLHEVNG